MTYDPRALTGLHYGDPIAINHPDLDEQATASYVGFAGGPTAQVQLDGTGALVNVPRIWIVRR